MMNTHSNFGFSESERRLCRFESDAEYTRKAISGSIKDFFSGLRARYEKIAGVEAKRTQNLLDEEQWVRAFNEDDVFTELTVEPLSSTGVISPRDVLLSLSLPERKIEFVRFMRAMVPDHVREAYRTSHPPLFTDEAFATFPPGTTLDMHMLDRTDEIDFGDPTDPRNREFQTMRAVSTALIGEDVREDPSWSGRIATLVGPGVIVLRQIREHAKVVARHTLHDRYGKFYAPKAPDDPHVDELSVAYSDFKDAIRSINPPPTETELANPKLLIEKIDPSSVSAARFRAALRLGIVTKAHLVDIFRQQYLKEESIEDIDAHRSRQQRDHLDRNVREKMRQRNRTLMENWHNMDGKWKFFTVALTAFAAYKMFKSKNGLIRSIPFLLGGALIYRRLVVGDENTLDTAGKFLQDTVEFTGRPIRSALQKVGILPDAEDIDKLRIMEKFLERNDMKQYPVAHLMALMANVHLENIAKAVEINADGTTYLQVDDVLRDKDGNPMIGGDGKPIKNSMLEDLKNVAQRNGLNGRGIIRNMRAPEHHTALSSAMGGVMYLLGTKVHPQLANSLEARRSAAGVQDVEDLTDATSIADRVKIMEAGRDLAATKYGGQDFIDVIPTLRNEVEEDPEKLDIENADNVPKPLELPNRENEVAMYDEIEKSDPIHRREEILGDGAVVDGAVEEFLDRNIQLGIVKDADRSFLEEAFRNMRLDEDVSTPEVLQAVAALEYALLAEAAGRNGPLSRSDIEAITGDKSIGREVIDNIFDFINANLLTVSSYFQEIDDLNSLQAILRERLKPAVVSSNGTGFDKLINRISDYEKRFKQLRRQNELNPILREQLNFDEGDTELLLVRLYGDKYRTVLRIDQMEKYFAHAGAEAVARAYLVQHRKSGQDILDPTKDKRVITLREEQNIINEMDALFAKIVGEVGPKGTHDKDEEGVWEYVDLIDKMRAIEAKDIDDARDALTSKAPLVDGDSYEKNVPVLRDLGDIWFNLKNAGRDAERVAIEGDIIPYVEEIEAHFRDKDFINKELVELAYLLAKAIGGHDDLVEKLEPIVEKAQGIKAPEFIYRDIIPLVKPVWEEGGRQAEKLYRWIVTRDLVKLIKDAEKARKKTVRIILDSEAVKLLKKTVASAGDAIEMTIEEALELLGQAEQYHKISKSKFSFEKDTGAYKFEMPDATANYTYKVTPIVLATDAAGNETRIPMPSHERSFAPPPDPTTGKPSIPEGSIDLDDVLAAPTTISPPAGYQVDGMEFEIQVDDEDGHEVIKTTLPQFEDVEAHEWIQEDLFETAVVLSVPVPIPAGGAPTRYNFMLPASTRGFTYTMHATYVGEHVAMPDFPNTITETHESLGAGFSQGFPLPPAATLPVAIPVYEYKKFRLEVQVTNRDGTLVYTKRYGGTPDMEW